MNLLLTNLALRLGSPTAHAIVIAIALFLTAPMSHAVELLIMDDLSCVYCKRFKADAGATYNESPYAEWAPLRYMIWSKGYRPHPHEWPDWFRAARDEGRINKVRGTPTFILYDTPPGEDKPREVGRILGYRGEEWFYDRLQFMRETYETWKASR